MRPGRSDHPARRRVRNDDERKLAQEWKSVGPSPTGVAFDGTYLYVVNFEGTTGSKIRPSDNAILTTFFAPEQATAIVVANKHLFVVSGHTVTEYR